MQTFPPYDEKILLEQVAVGDEQAFTQLFHYWQPFLATHIYRIIESKELTKEIVQDVFLKIWQTRETLSDIYQFKGYLLVVSKNHALNTLQKKAREFSNWEKWANENNKSDETIDPKLAYYSLIDEAIGQLSERQREVSYTPVLITTQSDGSFELNRDNLLITEGRKISLSVNQENKEGYTIDVENPFISINQQLARPD